MWVDSHDGVVVVEIRLDLVEGVTDGSAASQFFKSELFISSLSAAPGHLT